MLSKTLYRKRLDLIMMNIDKGFTIEIGLKCKDGMKYDSITKFYTKNGKLEAEYFYYKGFVNWLLSYNFSKGSLGELRKAKSSKVKKPFFNLKNGWFGYDDF